MTFTSAFTSRYRNDAALPSIGTRRRLARTASRLLVVGGLTAASIALFPTLEPAVAGTQTVDIKSLQFTPSEITANVGDEIVFKSYDVDTHGVNGGPLSSPDLHQGDEYRFTVSSPGDISYSCKYHAFMHGMIKVAGTGGGEAPPPAPSAPAPKPVPVPVPVPVPAPSLGGGGGLPDLGSLLPGLGDLLPGLGDLLPGSAPPTPGVTAGLPLPNGLPELPIIGELPIGSLPDLPIDSLPDLPIDSLPDLPIDSLPDLPIDSLPDLPIDSLPDLPIDSLPDLPIDSLPDLPL